MSARTTVVLFSPNKQPRVLHGVDINHFKDHSDCLINPEIPKGIPPHRWFKDGDKIGINPENSQTVSSVNNQITVIDRKLSKVEYIKLITLMVCISAAISLGIKLLF